MLRDRSHFVYDEIVKPHPRIRKMVKWGGAVASVLLMGAWVGSVWWKVSKGNTFWSRTSSN